MSTTHTVEPLPGDSIEVAFPYYSWILSVIISGAPYGVMVPLYFACFYVLRASSMISRRMRRVLLVYINVMFSINTALTVFDFMALNNSIFNLPPNTPQAPVPLGSWGHFVAFHTANSLTSSICFVLLTWGGQIFLIWRCIALHRVKRNFLRVGVITLCFLLAALSLASGVLLLYSTLVILNPRITRFGDQQLQLYWFSITFILFSSLLVNSLITGMIVARLAYQHHILREMIPQPDRDSVYMKMAKAAMESGLLVVLNNSITFVLVQAFPLPSIGWLFISMNNISQVSWRLMPHLYMISPFLIIFQIARGRDEGTKHDAKVIELRDGPNTAPMTFPLGSAAGSPAFPHSAFSSVSADHRAGLSNRSRASDSDEIEISSF